MGGEPASWLPIHLAAGFSPSPEVVKKLLEKGGLEHFVEAKGELIVRAGSAGVGDDGRLWRSCGQRSNDHLLLEFGVVVAGR